MTQFVIQAPQGLFADGYKPVLALMLSDGSEEDELALVIHEGKAIWFSIDDLTFEVNR